MRKTCRRGGDLLSFLNASGFPCWTSFGTPKTSKATPCYPTSSPPFNHPQPIPQHPSSNRFVLSNPLHLPTSSFVLRRCRRLSPSFGGQGRLEPHGEERSAAQRRETDGGRNTSSGSVDRCDPWDPCSRIHLCKAVFVHGV